MGLTFFEDLCALQTTFSKSDIVSLRGFDGHEDMIEEIYMKGITIILSNFEGNEEKTYKQLDSKLEPKFLTNILSKKLKEMNLNSKESVI